jgi:uncharacterized Zn finger protein
MERVRRYAHGGRVQDLTVKAGRLETRVQGSRATPYRVSVRSEAPSKTKWRALEAAMAAWLGWTAQLLAGEVPRDLEEPFAKVGCPCSHVAGEICRCAAAAPTTLNHRVMASSDRCRIVPCGPNVTISP